MLFAQKQYKYLAQNFVAHEDFVVQQFANQEFIIKNILSNKDEKTLVVGSLTGPSDQVIELLMLLQALQQRPVNLTLFSPYLGYQRQDVGLPGKSYGLLWADAMLHAVGVHRVITIDVHNIDSLSILKIPVMSLSSELIFAQDVAQFVAAGFTFIFPDDGALQRYRWAQEKFPLVSYGFFSKKRKHGIVELQNFQGKVSKKVIIFDDILDSGQTLLQVCIALRQLGVQEIIIFVTHAFFHGQVWNDLWNFGVKLLYCSNTVPIAHQIDHPQIRVISISSLLQKYV